MLRVTTLHASSAAATAAYYAQYLTQAPGEEPGVWTGRQAAGLGLSGAVSVEALQALLEGCDPIAGSQLGYELKDRILANGNVVRAVAGFDATFSAPKSVSVLWALTQHPGLLAAHDAAVTAALTLLERFGSTTRIRAGGGRLHPDSQGLTIATFRQTTSRADDPQVHTHAVISAKVQTVDGRWLALDARYLKRYQRMLGGLYQSALRSELVDRYRVAWGPITNGQAEIVGVPPELLTVFSKRTTEVEGALAAKVAEFRGREGRDPSRWERAALTREASADTRAHKSGIGIPDLRTRWTAEAADLQWTAHDLAAVVHGAGRERAGDPVARLTIAEVVEGLSVSGSTWNRADVLRAVCDVQRPIAGKPADRWAAGLERVVDAVIDACEELDPTSVGTFRRDSDGRSVWLEPVAPHLTSRQVLIEEHHVLAWAAAAHTVEPDRSPSVEVGGLDVLQAAVAGAVAGRDRLVLVVGPAGTGKTTSLRAAVDDLTRQGRLVFGVAPSAKAARVLEAGTGVRADTLAKLLHECERRDRRPDPRYQLPAGATILVDEAGMVGTSALDRLVTLAEQRGWRLVLVGDHRQLQAVGRGGLFHELCVTGRTHQLTHIHRFTEPWEAAASLLLRHGDLRALDPYVDHGRIEPGTFDDHLERITRLWLDTTATGGTVAVTTATNEHVDKINTAIQTARRHAGQLDPASVAVVGGGERAYLGDVVVTRRNDRTLPTSRGEPVRNRDRWTITAITTDGAITVASLAGSGTVTLPAAYVREHVRLGYAATEHGNQGDTTTIGIELATAATTRRGLYVGATRGREQNLILVVTESPDLDDARDVLDHVLTSERVDIPATTQRRTLATIDRPSVRARPVQPRCVIPDWFGDLRAGIARDRADATESAAVDTARVADLEQRLTDARHRRDVAAAGLAPYQPALDAARTAVDSARAEQGRAKIRAAQAKGLGRRQARRDLEQATQNYEQARAAQRIVDATAEPAQAAYRQAADEVRDVQGSLATARLLVDWSRPAGTVAHLSALSDALDGWQRWATGETVTVDELATIVGTLDGATGRQTACATLAVLFRAWADHANVELPFRSLAGIHRRALAPDCGIDL